MPDKIAPEIPIEISPDQLSESALLGIVEAFILREGTDYGVVEISHEAKINQIRRQLDQKIIRIIFDQTTESVSIVPTNVSF
jgi:uncharacterized protein